MVVSSRWPAKFWLGFCALWLVGCGYDCLSAPCLGAQGKHVNEESESSAPPLPCVAHSMEPPIGGQDVPIAGSLTIEWSAPIDEGSIAGSVTLTHLPSGETVAVQGKRINESTLSIQPLHSLRFWSSYSLAVQGLRSASGVLCEGALIPFSTVEPSHVDRPVRAAAAVGLVAREDRVIVAGDMYRGLQRYNIATSAFGDLLITLSGTDIPAAASLLGLERFGDRAFAPAGRQGVWAMGLSDDDAPTPLVTVPGFTSDVAPFEHTGPNGISKEYLAISAGDEGLYVFNVSNGIIEGHIDVPSVSSLSRVAVQVVANDVQIAAAGGSSVALISLPDPSHPESAVVKSTITGLDALTDILLKGDRLYVARNTAGVHSFDISSLSMPVQLPVGVNECPAYPSLCADRYVSLAWAELGGQGRLLAAARRGGVAVLDPVHMSVVKRYPAEGEPLIDARVAIAHSGMILIGAEEGLRVVEPESGKTLGPTLNAEQAPAGMAQAVAIQGATAFVASSFSGVQIFDINNPLNPVRKSFDGESELLTPSCLNPTATEAVWDVEVAGTTLFVADGQGRADQIGDSAEAPRLFSYALPIGEDATPASEHLAKDHVRTLYLGQDRLLACHDNAGFSIMEPGVPSTYRVLDFSDISNIAPCAPEVTSIKCSDLVESNQVVYVGSWGCILRANVAEPTKPYWLPPIAVASNGLVTSLAKSGDHLVVVTREAAEGEGMAYTRRLQVLAPNQPDPIIWSSDDLKAAARISVIGDKVFLATDTRGIGVFDIADVTQPFLEGWIETPGAVAFVSWGPGVLFAAETSRGLQVIRTGLLPKPL